MLNRTNRRRFASRAVSNAAKSRCRTQLRLRRVVEGAGADPAVVEREAARLDHLERHAEAGAQPQDRAEIVRPVRLIERKTQRGGDCGRHLPAAGHAALAIAASKAMKLQ